MKSEDPKLVAMARALFEGHDPDEGHEKPIRHEGDVEPDELDGLRTTPFKDLNTLAAFHHWSGSSYIDNEEDTTYHDHGHILRRPGEDPEAFFRRAKGIALKASIATGGPIVNTAHSYPSLQSYADDHNRMGVYNNYRHPAAVSHNHPPEPEDIELADEYGEGDEPAHRYTRHMLFPVHRN